jgi:adenylate cyclase
MSGDPEQEYFSDGISEDLTTELARSHYLFVISRNSAFMYKGEHVSVEKVGRELGVRYVLEGSVRKADGRVRITAQLIDATTGGHLWSERYDRELSDIFALQSEITGEILAKVGSEIGMAESRRVARKPSGSLTAVDAFWKGRYLAHRNTRKSTQEARRLFERAITLDPGYVAAWAVLANTYSAEFVNGWSSDPKLLDRAEELGRRAVALDLSHPGGHLTLAYVNLFRGRLPEAIAAAERSIELAPNFEWPHAIRGMALAEDGRFVEATRSIKQALRINPRSPTGLLMFVAYVNFGAGRRREAVELLEQVRAANPDDIVSRVGLAVVYEQEGRHEDASAAVREILLVTPDLTVERAMKLIPRWESILSAQEFAQVPDNLGKAGLKE